MKKFSILCTCNLHISSFRYCWLFFWFLFYSDLNMQLNQIEYFLYFMLFRIHIYRGLEYYRPRCDVWRVTLFVTLYSTGDIDHESSQEAATWGGQADWGQTYRHHGCCDIFSRQHRTRHPSVVQPLRRWSWWSASPPSGFVPFHECIFGMRLILDDPCRQRPRC